MVGRNCKLVIFGHLLFKKMLFVISVYKERIKLLYLYLILKMPYYAMLYVAQSKFAAGVTL